MESSNVEQCGRNLRHDILTAYESAKGSDTFHRGVDITDLVTKYIRVGSSFDDAEAILRSAGCKVGGRFLDNHTGRLGREDDVCGEFSLARLFPSATDFLALLTPRVPGDYSVIDKVEAVIAVTFI
jgi:hypothetical protein